MDCLRNLSFFFLLFFPDASYPTHHPKILEDNVPPRNPSPFLFIYLSFFFLFGFIYYSFFFRMVRIQRCLGLFVPPKGTWGWREISPTSAFRTNRPAFLYARRINFIQFFSASRFFFPSRRNVPKSHSVILNASCKRVL